LVEQRFRKPQVARSIRVAGSSLFKHFQKTRVTLFLSKRGIGGGIFTVFLWPFKDALGATAHSFGINDRSCVEAVLLRGKPSGHSEASNAGLIFGSEK
jgi:hypothetical protein